MSSATPASPTAPAPGPQIRLDPKIVLPFLGLVFVTLIASTVVTAVLVSQPFQVQPPPPLEANVTPEYRVYDHDRREAQSIAVQAANKRLIVHILQISIGMVLGFVTVFLGCVLCWYGSTGAFVMNAEGGPAKLNIQGAQVGLVLLIGGVILTGLSITKAAGGSGKVQTKEVDYAESDLTDSVGGGASNAFAPGRPPKMFKEPAGQPKSN